MSASGTHEPERAVPPRDATEPRAAGPLIPWAAVRERLGSRDWVLALAVVALGAVLRSVGFDAFWVNPDEGLNYAIASAPTFGEFWREVQDNAHPPLYYLLLWCMDLVATDVAWFRSLSLVTGCLSILVTYYLGREAGGVATGLTAAFLVAVSPSAVELSQVIRPYMLQLAALAAAMLFLVRYLRTRNSQDRWRYSACMVIALLTHYSSLLVLGGVGAALLVDRVAAPAAGARPRTGDLRGLAIAHLPIGLALGGMAFHLRTLMNSRLQVQAQTHSLAEHMIAAPEDLWPNFIGVMRYLFGVGYSGPTILLLVVGLLITARRRAYPLLALPLAVLGLAVLAAALRQYPFGISRHSAYLLAVLPVPVAVPLAAVLERGRTGLIAALVGGAVLVLARGPVSRALGADLNPYRATEERIIPRDRIPAVARRLQRDGNERRPVLMGLQTWYCLVPLFDAERHRRQWHSGGLFHVPWGDGELLVNVAWTMTAEKDPPVPQESFYGFLRRIDAARPDLQVTRRRDARVLVAGWETDLVAGIVEFAAADTEEARSLMVVSPRRVLYLAGLRVDLQRFVESVGG